MNDPTLFATHYGDRVEIKVDMTVQEVMDVIEALQEMIEDERAAFEAGQYVN